MIGVENVLGEEGFGDYMNCPFCNEEMIKGAIKGEGRTKMHWCPEGEKLSMGDYFLGTGIVTAANYRLGEMKMESYFCKECKKMIIDTDVQE